MHAFLIAMLVLAGVGIGICIPGLLDEVRARR